MLSLFAIKFFIEKICYIKSGLLIQQAAFYIHFRSDSNHFNTTSTPSPGASVNVKFFPVRLYSVAFWITSLA